jgi:hypothetical protein
MRYQPTGRVERVLLLSVVVALAVLLRAAGWCADKDPRPNIIFILTDDFGWGDLGCYGGKEVPTPCLDRMAREGIRFTQFYMAAPIRAPSV